MDYTSFNQEFNKTLINYAIEHDFVFFRPRGKEKYLFKHKSKMPQGVSYLDNNQDDYGIYINNLYYNGSSKRWKINEAGNHIFLYFIKNIDEKHKGDTYNHYGFFNTFKNIVSYLILHNKYQIAQELFSQSKVHLDKLRSSEEEEKMIISLYNTYQDKNLFLEHLEKYLFNHSAQYGDRLNGKDKQFMLSGFLLDNFPTNDIQRFSKYLTVKDLNTKEENIFEEYDYHIETIILDNKKFYSSLNIDTDKNADLLTIYSRISAYTFEYMNEYFKPHGLVNCSQYYGEGYNKQNTGVSIYQLHLAKDTQLSKKEIYQFFTEASKFLAKRPHVLESQQSTSEALKELNPYLVSSKLKSELNIKNSDNKKRKI